MRTSGGRTAPYSLDFEHRVVGRSSDEAHRAIEAWLREQKGQVKESRAPMFLEGTHGRALQPMGWRKDARKTLTFDLYTEGADVLVRVRITPPMLNVTDVQMREDEARANWNELLAELWVRLGEAGAVQEAIRRPPVDWNVSLQRGRGMVRGGALLLGVAVVVQIVLILVVPTVAIAAVGLFVAGGLPLMYGAMTVRSAKRRLARQQGRS